MPNRRVLFFLAAVVAVALPVIVTRATSNNLNFDAAQLKDTAVWNKVNAEPYRTSGAVDFLCGLPTTKTKPKEKKNPHEATFITVYVNNTGREAMFATEAQTFPQGSMIVKEKINSRLAGSNKPVLYTIMRKREPGFNPSVGDWEFAVVGPNGKDVQGIGKLANCQSCHRPKRDSDFVFRSYVKSD